MSLQLTIGLIINTILFGVMGFSNQKLGIKTPKVLQNKFVGMLLVIIYVLSFFVILLASEAWWVKILISLLMQFLINHIIWGIVTGLIAGRLERRK